jgi:hypothetical protein
MLNQSKELGIGGVAGVDKNPNPIFGFFKAMYDRNKSRMPDYVHTGTPFTSLFMKLPWRNTIT